MARSAATRRDVDRCAELERAISHCGHIDYLLTLVDTLEWLPGDEVSSLKTRWQDLRELLGEDVQGLSAAMTLRRGHEWARDRVAIVLTSSIPASPVRPSLFAGEDLATKELSLHDPSIIDVAEIVESAAPVAGRALIAGASPRAPFSFDEPLGNQTVPEGPATLSRRLRRV